MNRKRIINLTKQDFLDKSIWEHWIEGNIEYAKPSNKKEINELDRNFFIVLTEFTLCNGIKLTGFCSPQDTSGMDYIQPVIFTENGQVSFWKDGDWNAEDKTLELNKIGYEIANIFPIEYKSLVKCNNEYFNGIILDFNQGH